MSPKAALTASVSGSGPKVFQPLASEHASGLSQIFADGFGRPVKSRDKAEDRPSGLDSRSGRSLYVSDDVRARAPHASRRTVVNCVTFL